MNHGNYNIGDLVVIDSFSSQHNGKIGTVVGCSYSLRLIDQPTHPTVMIRSENLLPYNSNLMALYGMMAAEQMKVKEHEMNIESIKQQINAIERGN